MDKKVPLPPPISGPPLVTPGWNDPPEVQKQQSNIPVGSKRILNKRVPFPLTPTQSVQSNSGELNEIVNNIMSAIDHLPDNASVKKDMERISINWNDVAGNIEVKQLIIQASKFIHEGDIIEVQNIHKQLSLIPAAGWFTLLFHSIIQLLNKSSK